MADDADDDAKPETDLHKMEFVAIDGRYRALPRGTSSQKGATLGDYHSPLPDGWQHKESSSHPGKFYYIQPSGGAVWVPPLVRTGHLYAWKLLIYIEFGPGKLGMNLRSIVQGPDIPWQQFQVEIHALVKLASGLPSPAEMYNWSVKPDRRIYPGFRMVEIQGTSIAGYSYNEVIEKISQTPRPVTIGFCDISRGLKGDPVDDEEDETELEPEEENKLRLRAIESEHMKTLVVTQLHKEVWAMDTTHLVFNEAASIAKGRVLEREMKVLRMVSTNYTHEIARLVPEKDGLQTHLDQLELERRHTIQPAEITKCQSLTARQQELLDTIEQLGVENKRLQDTFAERTALLDRMYVELEDEVATPERISSSQLLDEYNITGPPLQKIDYCHMLYFQLQEALQVEQDKAKLAQEEVNQLSRHLEDMNSRESAVALAAASSDAILGTSSNESSIRDLEMKLEWLRHQLHKTVATIAKAEKRGNEKMAKAGLRRRNLLKSEIQVVHDELASKRSARGTQLSCSTEVDLLERKTSYLRNALRETVDAIAKTTVNDDRAMYLARKAFLKKELQTTGERMQEVVHMEALGGRRSSNILRSPLQALARKSLAFDDDDDEYDANDFRTSAFVDSPDLPGTPVEFAESLSPVSESPPMPAQVPRTVAPPLLALDASPSVPKMPQMPPPPQAPFLPLPTYMAPVAAVETPPTVQSPDHGFAAQLTDALSVVRDSQRLSLNSLHDEQPSASDVDRITESIRSLHDNDVDTDNENDDDVSAARRLEQLKKELRIVSAQLASTPRSQSHVISKLHRDRTRLKAAVSQAQDQVLVEALQQQLRAAMAQATQAAAQGDRAREIHYKRKAAELQTELSAATDRLVIAAKPTPSLDDLKNDLRAVVKRIAEPNGCAMEDLLAQKHELKKAIVAKQQEILKERAKRDEGLSLEELKSQLKQVVMAMTKDVDNIMLQQRRKHIKQRIAKLQDRQHGSSASSNGLRSESSSNDSAPHDYLQQRAHMNSTELLVGDMDRARFNATELLARPDVDARRLNHTELHADARRRFGGTELHSGSSSMSSEGKRRSNSVEGRGVSSHSSVSSSSNSSNGMRLHDPADYASLTLDQLEHELLVVKEAMRAPQLDGLTKDRYRRQLSELNARIARAEADAKRDSSVLRSELAELKQHLKAVGTRLEETTHEKTFRALLQKRADLKGKIARLEQQLVPEMPPAPAPLHPNASPAEITMYISGRKRELRNVVQELMKTTKDKDSVSSSHYMARRKELKQAILTAQEALQRTSAVTTASTDAPTSRPPSEAMPETMDAPAVEKRIAGLKQELREIVSAVAQPTASTAQKPELLRRRSIVKEHLAAAQDHLAQITSPDVEKARHEIAVVQQYIASLQDDLAAVLAKINSKAPADLAKSSLYMMRRNDLKNNLSFAQDQLVELTQNLKAALAKARPIPSRSSTASSDKRDSSKAEVLDESIPLSSEDHVRMTQTYNAPTPMQTGYLELEPLSLEPFCKGKFVWCSIEASGCLCWYKSQRDLKHVRGYVDLAKTSARNVFVNYARGNTFDLHVVSPGLLANTEEVSRFIAPSPAEAQKWVRAINDTIKVLETATPMGADGYGRNSVVF
ncbi:hypothetical protein SPRG_19491 [Saprolegnia parasitica CBS 223.65]|uniref:WW domain-containing protein n=1 Tax=Saprolegnia parasitica (strain CBS 223.65) TaxID=695850 RepID=A0A067CP15_SAPPC|nr:hypothetical protein SPRG_19491 [Saprolegnia parasitica CBS 223.65]KDO32213.1 hypothetical protein SPRG_19491 [Saprolegnia parasitica CBS 223.65]|eukprot:XP_012197416.1 hypothetical protein SPRG_19491 [Saprolegnia parasitica CBS 223.65]